MGMPDPHAPAQDRDELELEYDVYTEVSSRRPDSEPADEDRESRLGSSPVRNRLALASLYFSESTCIRPKNALVGILLGHNLAPTLPRFGLRAPGSLVGG